jgi:serine/threonine protein kinase
MFGLERYKKIERIGEGSYGVVYKASDIVNGRLVAIKKLKANMFHQGLHSTTIREIAVLRELRHPTLVQFFFFFFFFYFYRLIDAIHTGKNFYLIFEYVNFDLQNFMKLRIKGNFDQPISPKYIKVIC